MKKESVSPKSMRSCVQRWGVTAYLRRHETHILKEAVEAHQRVVLILIVLLYVCPHTRAPVCVALEAGDESKARFQ